MKRLLILWGCLSMLQTQATPIAELDFQNNSEKLTLQSFNLLNHVVLDFYGASDIHLQFRVNRNYQTDMKQKVLLEKRIMEIEEFLLEEHIPKEIVSLDILEKQNVNDCDLTIQTNYTKERNEILRVTPATIHIAGKYNLNFKELDRSSVEAARIDLNEAVNAEQLSKYNSISSKRQVLIIHKLIEANYTSEHPIANGLEMEFTLSPELAKKKMQLFIWNANAQSWDPIGTAKTNKTKNDLDEFFTQIDISQSGTYAWAEALSGTKLKATVHAPKMKAITSCQYISTAPYIQVGGEISTNQASATIDIPKAVQKGYITCTLTHANGQTEEINCEINTSKWQAFKHLFQPNKISVTYK